MPDYEQMYYTLLRASEEAIRIIIDAQRKCEEIYISGECGASDENDVK